MIAYFAHPIDLASDPLSGDEGAIRHVLRGHNIGIFDPALAWSPPARWDSNDARTVMAGNQGALMACDLVVALLNQMSIGVPVEAVSAAQQGKPVIVYGLANAENSMFIRGLGMRWAYDPFQLGHLLHELLEDA